MKKEGLIKFCIRGGRIVRTMHVATTSTWNWSVPSPHHGGTVFSLPVWIDLIDGVEADSHTETVILAFLQNQIARISASKRPTTDCGCCYCCCCC